MSPRRTILRELRKRRAKHAARYTRPATIPGFTDNPGRHQEAINRLLQQRLINGTKDHEGRLSNALNEHRLADVSRSSGLPCARRYGQEQKNTSPGLSNPIRLSPQQIFACRGQAFPDQRHASNPTIRHRGQTHAHKCGP